MKLEDVVRDHILKCLEECNGNRSQAAKKLGISIRTIQRRLLSFGLQDYPPKTRPDIKMRKTLCSLKVDNLQDLHVYCVKEKTKSLDSGKERVFSREIKGLSFALAAAQSIIEKGIRRKMTCIEKEQLSELYYYGNKGWNVTISKNIHSS